MIVGMSATRLTARKDPKWVMRLYVMGNGLNSRTAIRNIQDVCRTHLDSWKLEIIDLLERPQLAEEQRIHAVPTLIRELPTPLRRLVGDFSLKDKVLLGLDIAPKGPGE
jgi:circadian clock protein KaiB